MADKEERVYHRLRSDDEVLDLITEVRAARHRLLATVTALGVKQESFKPRADE